MKFQFLKMNKEMKQFDKTYREATGDWEMSSSDVVLDVASSTSDATASCSEGSTSVVDVSSAAAVSSTAVSSEVSSLLSARSEDVPSQMRRLALATHSLSDVSPEDSCTRMCAASPLASCTSAVVVVETGLGIACPR